MKTVYIWGSAERFANYRRAVEAAGGRVRFGGDPAGCDALLLPGGGDLEPWRYGQRNTASVGLESMRDAMELQLLQQFVLRKKPVLGICRGLQTINVYFGGTLLGTFDDLDAQVTGVSTDSRDIKEGSLFIPLEGERFDGHSFINGALEAGAAGCITARQCMLLIRHRLISVPGVRIPSTHTAMLLRYVPKRARPETSVSTARIPSRHPSPRSARPAHQQAPTLPSS